MPNQCAEEEDKAEQAAPTPEQFLAVLEEVYFAVKKRRRSIRLQDRLSAALGLDSLDALEVMVALEERYGVALVDTDHAEGLGTAGELYDVIVTLVSEAA